MIPVKFMKKKINFLSSFSLIEVLIFITILSIFFVAAASVTIGVLRDIKINEHKILATRYASELTEWLSGEKEKGWDEFTSENHFSDGESVCFDDLSSNLGWDKSCNLIGSIFTRRAVFDKKPASYPFNEVDVNVFVTWDELGKTKSVELVKIFKPWE